MEFLNEILFSWEVERVMESYNYDEFSAKVQDKNLLSECGERGLHWRKQKTCENFQQIKNVCNMRIISKSWNVPGIFSVCEVNAFTN